MSSRLFLFSILFIIFSTIFYIFTFNKSYEKSLEAKVYYYLGNYQASYKLAQEAYTIDHYNRMAFTILTQSKNSIKYLNFINDATIYYEQIDKITDKKTLSSEDKMRISMMCKITIDEYDIIMKYKTSFTDDDLIHRATVLKNKFQVILDSLKNRGKN